MRTTKNLGNIHQVILVKFLIFVLHFFPDISCYFRWEKLVKSKEKTYRACAHDALVTLLRWEEVVLVEALSWLINSSVVPAGLDRSSQPCGDPDLIT